MISMVYRDVFGGLIFVAFRAKSIPVTVSVMISPSLIEPPVFFLIKSTHLCFMFFNNHLVQSKAYYVTSMGLLVAGVPRPIPYLRFKKSFSYMQRAHKHQWPTNQPQQFHRYRHKRFSDSTTRRDDGASWGVGSIIACIFTTFFALLKILSFIASCLLGFSWALAVFFNIWKRENLTEKWVAAFD